MDLNRVMLIGRLAQDPELRTLPSGNSVASFSVATSKQWTDKAGQKQKHTEFHRVVAWSKLAEIAGQYLHKGRQVFIEGRLQTHDWTGADGVKKYRTEVVAENFIMLGNKPPSAALGAPGKPATDDPESEDGPQEVIEEEVKVEAIPF